MKKSKLFYGWYLVAITWIIYFINVGVPLYGGTVINSLMVLDLGISSTTMGLAVTVSTACQGFGSPIAGACIKKIGHKKTFIAGACLTIIASLCLAIIQPTGILYIILYGAVIACGVALGCLVGGQSLVNNWFDKEKPTALALLLTAGTIGGAIASPIFEKISSAAGWKWAWIACAIFSGIGIVLTLLFVKEKPEDIGEVKDGLAYSQKAEAKAEKKGKKAPAKPYTHDLTMSEALHTREFWTFAFLSAFRAALYFGMIGHIVVFAMKSGYSSTAAAGLISMISIAGFCGRLLGGVIGRMIPSKMAVAAAFITMGLSGVVFFFGTGTINFTISAILLGLGFGTNYVAAALMTGEYFGTTNFPVITGIIIMIGNGLGSFGSTILGKMAEVTGTYSVTFGIFGCCCVAAGLIVTTFKISPLRYLKDEE